MLASHETHTLGPDLDTKHAGSRISREIHPEGLAKFGMAKTWQLQVTSLAVPELSVAHKT